MNKLRLSHDLHSRIMKHLHPGDGCEAIAFILCGSHISDDVVLAGHDLHLVPHATCKIRRSDSLRWQTESALPALNRANHAQFSLVKIHSHPSGYRNFSNSDDHSDRQFFPAAHLWMNTPRPHASAILLPDGEIVARLVDDDGEFTPIHSVLLAGQDIRFWTRVSEGSPRFADRTAQAFGEGTIRLLQSLKIGVVGCSGTGSLVIEQLVRLGVGSLVLVDPDIMGEENLNRITNATRKDAVSRIQKVSALASRVAEVGLGTKVIALPYDVRTPEAVRALACCDVVFGCMDKVLGRHALSRLATYYCIPYIDVGVRLDADGQGGIDQIAGAIHYLSPGSTLR